MVPDIPVQNSNYKDSQVPKVNQNRKIQKINTGKPARSDRSAKQLLYYTLYKPVVVVQYHTLQTAKSLKSSKAG
jgi:hypothetical protein